MPGQVIKADNMIFFNHSTINKSVFSLTSPHLLFEILEHAYSVVQGVMLLFPPLPLLTPHSREMLVALLIILRYRLLMFGMYPCWTGYKWVQKSYT